MGLLRTQQRLEIYDEQVAAVLDEPYDPAAEYYGNVLGSIKLTKVGHLTDKVMRLVGMKGLEVDNG